MAGARHAVDLPHQHRDPRHGRLVDGVQRPGAAADRAGALGVGADQEARLIDEVGERQVELVAEVDEAGELLGGVRGQAAARSGWGRRRARRPGRPSSRASAVISDGPKRAPISNIEPRSSTPSRMRRILYGRARVARDDPDELLLAPVGRVGGRQDGRRLPDVVRQVGEEAAELRRTRPPRPRPRCPPHPPWSACGPRPAPPCRAISPMAAATTGGPATKSWAVPRTITEKCEATTRAAPSPATGPSAAATTGTIAWFCPTRSKPGSGGT